MAELRDVVQVVKQFKLDMLDHYEGETMEVGCNDLADLVNAYEEAIAELKAVATPTE